MVAGTSDLSESQTFLSRKQKDHPALSGQPSPQPCMAFLLPAAVLAQHTVAVLACRVALWLAGTCSLLLHVHSAQPLRVFFFSGWR